MPSAGFQWSQGINSAPCAACRALSPAPEGAVAVYFADFVKIRKVLGKMKLTAVGERDARSVRRQRALGIGHWAMGNGQRQLATGNRKTGNVKLKT